MTEVLIAGGAVMGASVAFWLTRLDPSLRVTVVEQDPSYATCSTALSAAGIRSQFTNEINVAISRFGIEFIRDFARWTGPEGGVPDLGLRENGYLFLTGTETGAAQLESLAAMQRALGAATEVLDRAELAARFPWMQLDDIVAGAFGPRDEGFFDNMGLLSGLKNAARATGAAWLSDRVTGFERDGDRILLDGETGTLIDAGDGAALAAALDRWLGDPAGRALAGEAARAHVAAHRTDQRQRHLAAHKVHHGVGRAAHLAQDRRFQVGSGRAVDHRLRAKRAQHFVLAGARDRMRHRAQDPAQLDQRRPDPAARAGDDHVVARRNLGRGQHVQRRLPGAHAEAGQFGIRQVGVRHGMELV